MGFSAGGYVAAGLSVFAEKPSVCPEAAGGNIRPDAAVLCYPVLTACRGLAHEAFLIVQNIRRSRRRPTKMGDMGIFSGLLYCAECGGKMYQCRATNFTEEQKYFICSTYRKGKDLCTTHSIKNVVLHEIVLRNLREAIEYVTQYEAEFIQEAADSRLRERDAEFSRKRETLSRAESRIAELDNLFKHLYEDNVTGKLSDERFMFS